MEETKSLQKQHNITVRDRKSMTITGVSEIISFDELCVVFDISDSQLNVEGSCLKIESFSNDSGDVTLTGQIDSIIYVGKTQPAYRRGLFKRMFSNAGE